MKRPDVCLLLEGTYPYVQGGVSAWVHRLIEEHPHLTFSLFFLGASRKGASTRYYELPDNVVDIKETFLFDRLPEDELTPAPLDAKTSRDLAEGLEAVYFAQDEAARINAIFALSDWLIMQKENVRFGNLLHDRCCWDVLCKVYARWFPAVSFIDFFWTCRIIYTPLWKMLRTVSAIPEAGIYHSICTGYAGAIGAIVSRRNRAPYILSEHGIYTKERMIEVTQADWIHEPPGGTLGGPVQMILKNIWITMFIALGRMTYEAANPVIALFSENARLQNDLGAPKEKMRVIPNGVHPARFDAIRRQRAEGAPQPAGDCRIAFIGRIVPIKDIKTLLRAARKVADVLPDVQFHFHGPSVEDSEYYHECLEMFDSLELQSCVSFHGSGRIEDILTDVDILVLTSISEGLPLVILEAFSCAIPVVATDVGACRELLNGKTPEDKKLGRAGILTTISSSSETADAIIHLAKDARLRREMGSAGHNRVVRFYDEDRIMAEYGSIYDSLQKKGRSPWPE